MKKMILFMTALLLFISCQRNARKVEETGGPRQGAVSLFSGDYVSDGYVRRDEGYDWVAVSIREKSDTVAEILIRSRSDKKKPTCTFEGEAVLNDDGSLISDLQDGKHMQLTLEGDTLKIEPFTAGDENMLYYYCSGGATLQGAYNRITGALDERQLRPQPFERNLSLQGISFNVHATSSGSLNTLTIRPVGLEVDNRPVELEIEGTVTNAEIEDLNSDGSPELMVYIQSAGSGSYGSVIAFSVNNKKSMSQVFLPDIMENPEARTGYMGHDEFAVVETTLVRRFPIYREDDSNINPTGGIRQIQYKMVDGEAGRLFRIDKIVEY